MRSSARKLATAACLVTIGVGVGVGIAGIYVGEVDDAPGAALIGFVLMIGAVALGVRTARRRS